MRNNLAKTDIAKMVINKNQLYVLGVELFKTFIKIYLKSDHIDSNSKNNNAFVTVTRYLMQKNQTPISEHIELKKLFSLLRCCIFAILAICMIQRDYSFNVSMTCNCLPTKSLSFYVILVCQEQYH